MAQIGLKKYAWTGAVSTHAWAGGGYHYPWTHASGGGLDLLARRPPFVVLTSSTMLRTGRRVSRWRMTVARSQRRRDRFADLLGRRVAPQIGGALPPRSGVRGPPCFSTSSKAATMAREAFASPRCSSIMAPDQIWAMGVGDAPAGDVGGAVVNGLEPGAVGIDRSGRGDPVHVPRIGIAVHGSSSPA